MQKELQSGLKLRGFTDKTVTFCLHNPHIF
jgi:hypothetical protein